MALLEKCRSNICRSGMEKPGPLTTAPLPFMCLVWTWIFVRSWNLYLSTWLWNTVFRFLLKCSYRVEEVRTWMQIKQDFLEMGTSCCWRQKVSRKGWPEWGGKKTPLIVKHLPLIVVLFSLSKRLYCLHEAVQGQQNETKPLSHLSWDSDSPG